MFADVFNPSATRTPIYFSGDSLGCQSSENQAICEFQPTHTNPSRMRQSVRNETLVMPVA